MPLCSGRALLHTPRRVRDASFLKKACPTCRGRPRKWRSLAPLASTLRPRGNNRRPRRRSDRKSTFPDSRRCWLAFSARDPIKADKAQKKLNSLASWAVERGCPDSCHAFLKQVMSRKGVSDKTMRGFKHQRGCAVAYAIDAIQHAPSTSDGAPFAWAGPGSRPDGLGGP